MVYVAEIVLVSLVLARLLVALVNYISRPYLRRSRFNRPIDTLPTLSILIPARDEEANILNILSDIAQNDPKTVEVLVYNDSSTDRTGLLVEQFSQQHPYVRLVNGSTLPEGWLGKNYACYQLARQASGHYLMFLDADVRIAPDFLMLVLRYMEHSQDVLMSIFPKQLMESRGEKLSVPAMHWILLSLLPIALVRATRMSSLSAANGQVMVFKAWRYRMFEPHLAMRSNRAEDIAIAGYLKQCDQRVSLYIGDGDVSCRMYSSYSQAIEGFAKNVRAFFGGSKLFMLLFWSMELVIPAAFLIAQNWGALTLVLLSMLAIKILTSATAKQSILFNVVNCIAQFGAFTQMICRNLQSNTRRIKWKGREI